MMKTTLIVSLIMIATNIYCQTTQEEYNFITKGYRFTIEHGLDMKNNYSMQTLTTYETAPSYFATIQGLFRENSGNLAGYLVTIKDGVFEKDVCIPIENSDAAIWKQYDAMLESLPLSTQRKFTVTLSRFLSQKPLFKQDNRLMTADTLTAKNGRLNTEEGTGGIVIPKKTNPLLPSNVEGINHHTIRFFPNHPQTGKDIQGHIKLKFCINKEGEIVEATALYPESSITDNDIIDLVISNVRKYKFSLNVYAPDSECGYITYTFTKTE